MTHIAGNPGVALVTGAGQGIGAGVAAALVAAGHRVILLARGRDQLEKTRALIDPDGTRTAIAAYDIRDDCAQRVVDTSLESFGKAPGVLVHAAGVFQAGPLAAASRDHLVDAFTTNVIGPIDLIRNVLTLTDQPHLQVPDRHVVVINSTAGLALNQTDSVHSSSQIAMRAMTDALRAEVNVRGIRVTSVFCGRTDTPRLQVILQRDEQPFDPMKALRPADVGAAVLAALRVSEHAEITEIVIRPLRK